MLAKISSSFGIESVHVSLPSPNLDYANSLLKVAPLTDCYFKQDDFTQLLLTNLEKQRDGTFTLILVHKLQGN
jgi:hypothetical protein